MTILANIRYQTLNLCQVFGLILCMFFCTGDGQATPQLNIYSWSNTISPKLLKKFTQETGIEIHLDPYDNGDLMEAKMLAEGSGYDLVFVSASPYLERQAKLGLYRPLDKSKISGYNSLSPEIMKLLAVADSGNTYSIPYVWGTTGFGVNKTKILELMPDAPLDSFALFFDPKIVSKITPCGVILLDSPIEVFPAVLSYLGLDPNSSNLEDLQKATEVLIRVKPYITKFQPVVTPRELSSGEACLVQGWSGEILHARKLVSKTKSKDEIEYHIAREGGFIWLDVMAIPKDAPHPELAYKFINFILDPINIAKSTNSLKAANAVPASRPYLKEGVKDNQAIYPPPGVVKNLDVDIIQPPQYERRRSREWTRVKTGR